MTLLDIVSKATADSRISVLKRTSDDYIIDQKKPADILDSIRFHNELKGLEVGSIEVGDFCDIVVTIEK